MPGTSRMTNCKHYKGKQNIGEVQPSQECGRWKPADWLGFFITSHQSNHVQNQGVLCLLKLETAASERSEWCGCFLMWKQAQYQYHKTISFYKLRQKKMAARYIELPSAPLSSKAPNGDTPAIRIFFVDNTNLIKFCYNQSD